MAGRKMHNLSWACVTVPEGGTSPSRVVLYASKLAACAGLNPYVAQQLLADEYRATVLRPAEGEGAEAWLSPEARAEAAVSRLPEPARLAVEAALASAPGLADAAEAQGALAAAAACEGVSAEALDVVRERLYTEQGKRAEPQIRRQAEAARGAPIAQCAHFRSSARPLLEVAGCAVHVGGKHDGAVGVGPDARVIEIKARQRRFLGAPLYERVQAHAYMAIFCKRRASIIESYLGEQREHDVPWDDALWADVLERCDAFLRPFLSGAQAGATPGRGPGVGPPADPEQKLDQNSGYTWGPV